MVERFLHRWPLKLLAAVSAYAIWLSVVSEGNIVRDFDIPLVVDPGTSLTFVVPPPKNVSVRVRGLETTMERIEPGGLTAELPLRAGELGERSVMLGDAQIRGLPRSVEVVKIQPDRVNVSIDRKLRAFLPVRPVWVGDLPPGYRMYGWRTVPERLEVEGPA
ncbi:MAG: hypothetical protein OER88_12670, partial [Planctomycetota bacterium]|nr:hypothetical protein [Planctomycetota bacterium]